MKKIRDDRFEKKERFFFTLKLSDNYYCQLDFQCNAEQNQSLITRYCKHLRWIWAHFE